MNERKKEIKRNAESKSRKVSLMSVRNATVELKCIFAGVAALCKTYLPQRNAPGSDLSPAVDSAQNALKFSNYYSKLYLRDCHSHSIDR